MNVVCENYNCHIVCYHSESHEYDKEECDCMCGMVKKFYRCIPVLDEGFNKEMDRIFKL